MKALHLEDKEELKTYLLDRTKYVGDCWIYTGPHSQEGYGRITINYITWEVNRISAYIYHNLDLKNNKLFALHKVECKYKSCWNPNHIYIGSHSDNMRDTVIAGTHHEVRKTQCPSGHPYDEENTRISTDGARHCKTCDRERANEKYKIRKELGIKKLSWRKRQEIVKKYLNENAPSKRKEETHE